MPTLTGTRVWRFASAVKHRRRSVVSQRGRSWLVLDRSWNRLGKEWEYVVVPALM